MNLIKINLLPYREQQEAKQKQQFQVIMAIGGLVGVAIVGAIYMKLNQAIEYQEARNATLESGIKELENKLNAVKDLRMRKENFLERKRKVEELDNKRFEGARVLDTLNQVVPSGSYLTALKGKGDGSNSSKDKENEYIIEGQSLVDTKTAALMAALPSTGIFDVPDLVEIKKMENSQGFVLQSVLVKQIYVPKPAKTPKVSTTAASQAASAPDAPAQ